MNMSVFRVAPSAEFKAEQELREAGFSAFVPFEYRYRRSGASRTRRTKIKVPVLHGYAFASGKPAEARHVRRKVGTLRRTEADHLQGLSGREIDNEPKPDTWAAGEPALIGSGPFEGSSVTVLEVRGKVALVRGFVFGAERDSIGVHISQLIKKPPDAA